MHMTYRVSVLPIWLFLFAAAALQIWRFLVQFAIVVDALGCICPYVLHVHTFHPLHGLSHRAASSFNRGEAGAGAFSKNG